MNYFEEVSFLLTKSELCLLYDLVSFGMKSVLICPFYFF